jgi:urease subunit alpha
VVALDRGEYAARYGPMTGDRVRLADTGLWVEGDDVELLAEEPVSGGDELSRLGRSPGSGRVGLDLGRVG